MGYLAKAVTGAGIGIVAIAAAPFTGGGSILGGATLAASLTGAGAVAAGAAGVGAVAGIAIEADREEQEIKYLKQEQEVSFGEGIKKGQTINAQEIAKHIDFYLATTALSYFVARCDGYISEEEEDEIAMDLDAISKNFDIPNSAKIKMAQIRNNINISWSEVESYLDKVSVQTLRKLANDVQEIIIADGNITNEELHTQQLFNNYIYNREINENEYS